MNHITQGTIYSFPINIVAPDGTPFIFTDSTSVVTWRDPTGEVLLTQTLIISDVGVTTTSDGIALVDDADDGLIQVTLTAAQTTAFPTGVVYWNLLVTDTDNDTDEPAKGELFITATGERVDVGPMTGISRLELRRMTLSRVGDLKILRATATGSDSTFIDANNLTGEANAYRDRQAYFAGGTTANVGLIRHVSGSDKAQRALGFGLALPAATAIGDEVELVNTRGVGFTIEAVHQAIDNAMATARTVVSIPLSYAPESAFDEDDGTVAIPATWRSFSGIEWQDDNGAWRPIRTSPRYGGDGWSVDSASRTVMVGGTWARRIDGQSVRLRGYGAPAMLTADADRTPVSADWLVAETVSQLLNGASLMYPTPERLRAAERAERGAQGLRYMLATRLAPNTIGLNR
jgi:hypothetical protein